MDLLENEEDLLRLAASSLSLRLRGRRKRFSVGAEYLACQLRASPEQLCAAAVIEDPGEQNVSPCRWVNRWSVAEKFFIPTKDYSVTDSGKHAGQFDTQFWNSPSPLYSYSGRKGLWD
ncbi:uncharacterized protein LOC143484711 isoform X1 [Brachyhypopomus gauderio]|uniref:uncharacterized protein LOC143484711 isoform X1 n=1 Tax=Brachyhypopomus gauderio TaxID=698409 RepID=UPI004042DFF1